MGDAERAGANAAASDLNFVRIMFFMLGIAIGVLIPYVIGRVSPVVPPATLYANDCPRDVDGAAICKGAFPPDSP